MHHSKTDGKYLLYDCTYEMKQRRSSANICILCAFSRASNYSIHRLNGPTGGFFGEGKWKNTSMEPFLLLHLIANAAWEAPGLEEVKLWTKSLPDTGEE